MLIKIISKIVPGITPISIWCDEYEKMLDLRDLQRKTCSKRKGNIGHIRNAIGRVRIGAVRPIHIAQTIHEIWQFGRHNTARRVLLEAKDLFAEAVPQD